MNTGAPPLGLPEAERRVRVMQSRLNHQWHEHMESRMQWKWHVRPYTEHPTREGEVYCAVVLDVFSRRVVGWSIDHSATSGLVTSALGMAIRNRQPGSGTVIHSDQGSSPPGLSLTCPPIRSRAVHGISLGSYAGRVVGPPAMAGPYRVGQRYLRIPQDLPQPATTPYRIGDANPDRIRENPLRQPNRHATDASELIPPNPVTITLIPSRTP